MPPFMKHISLEVVMEELTKWKKSALLSHCSCDVDVFLLALDFTPVANFSRCQIVDSCYSFMYKQNTPNPIVYVYNETAALAGCLRMDTLSVLCMLIGNQHCFCYQDRHLAKAFRQSLEKHGDNCPNWWKLAYENVWSSWLLILVPRCKLIENHFFMQL